MDDFAVYDKKQVRNRALFVLIIFLLCIYALCRYVYTLIEPPASFPTPYHLIIEPGQTLFSLSSELYRNGAIASPRLFEIFMISLGSEHTISDGEYYFSEPLSSFALALRISGRDFGITRTKVTFPEGFTAQDMANRLGAEFPDFDTALFLALAKDHEGYLFPDTYSFFPRVAPDLVVRTLQQNFLTKTQNLQQQAAQEGKKWSDIIIMASIIEKESAGDTDRGIVSGILWKRFNSGMPLQVDAPFLYVLNKKSSELTSKDITINSPYNTYKNKGLPPAPICNPGLAAITAALYPVDSPYVYYLHDASGEIHYAKTYREHEQNIKKYLK